MNYNTKSIGPVVATALLLVVAVVSAVGFQTWFNNYSSAIFTNVETNNNLVSVEFLDSTDENLYFKSTGVQGVKSLKILNSNSEVVCELTNNSAELDLVHHWAFDEANSTHHFDIGPYKNNGTLSGGAQLFQGIIGSAYDGTRNTGANSDLVGDFQLGISDNFTISFWVNYNEIFVNDQIIVNSWDGTDLNGIRLIVDDVFESGFCDGIIGLQIQLGNATASFQAEACKNLTTNTWNHYVFTYNQSELISYVDGVQVSNSSNALRANLTHQIPASILLGSSFNGSIDEFRVYNQSLSSTQVENLYEFNSNSISFVNGINKIPVVGCNLIQDQRYSLALVTNDGVISSTFIDK